MTSAMRKKQRKGLRHEAHVVSGKRSEQWYITRSSSGVHLYAIPLTAANNTLFHRCERTSLRRSSNSRLHNIQAPPSPTESSQSVSSLPTYILPIFFHNLHRIEAFPNMAPQTSIPVAANILGTIGTVFWCIQLLPQIWYNWKQKKTDGLPGLMMFLWAICTFPNPSLVQWF